MNEDDLEFIDASSNLDEDRLRKAIEGGFNYIATPFNAGFVSSFMDLVCGGPPEWDGLKQAHDEFETLEKMWGAK